MGVINSGHFSYLLWPGVNKVYQTAYKERPTEYDKIFEKNTSDKAYEEEVGYLGFGLAPEVADGDGISYDTTQQGYRKRYTHIKYGLGFIITKDTYDDLQYEIPVKRKAQGLAFSMRQTKEIVGANVLNRAFNSSYPGADGLELCSTLHPNMSGGTWQNEPTTAVDLSEASLEQAVISIGDYKTDRGLQIAIMPKRLVTPKELIFDATRILESVGQNNSANNAINALKTLGAVPETAVNHYLGDTDAWFVLTDAPDGLKYFERRADSFDVDNDFDTENAKFKAVGRYCFGWTDPRCIYGSPGV